MICQFRYGDNYKNDIDISMKCVPRIGETVLLDLHQCGCRLVVTKVVWSAIKDQKNNQVFIYCKPCTE